MKKRLKDVWKPMLIVAFLFILGSFLPNGKQILFYMAAVCLILLICFLAAMFLLDRYQKSKTPYMSDYLKTCDAKKFLEQCEQLERKKKAEELLEMVGLADQAQKYPAQLSGGQQQRVSIARALANDPKVLLCDEPTSALDPLTATSILNLLKKINEELGVTVIIITHQIQVVKKICNRMAVIHESSIAEQGSVEEIFEDPKCLITRQLLGRVDWDA